MRVTIPYLVSPRGYGFLWNNPAVGRVELMPERTRWVAEATAQLDYWVVTGDTPAALVEAYAAATGLPASMPDWCLGFWQSTLRYPSQQALVRQYGTFCPIFRLHGYRSPGAGIGGPGAPNQVWSFGARAYPILVEHLRLRERLRPYLGDQARRAVTTGLAPMRPLFVDFPDDPGAWLPDDQFLLGPDLLVAPVTAPAVVTRPVYLPAGAAWRERATGLRHEGGARVEASAPLERIPLFVRDGAPDPFVGG